MREFKVAAKQASKETMEFKFDDSDAVMVSLRPTEAQLVTFMAIQVSEMRNDSEQIAAFIDFADAIFDDDTRRHVHRRLFDREDSFDHEVLAAVVMGLIEDWSQRPTKPFSDSTGSPENGGTPSGAGVPVTESTSSTSTQLTPVP